MRVTGGVRIQRNQILNPWPKADEGFWIWLFRKHSGRIVWMPPGSSQRASRTESFSMFLLINAMIWSSILVMAAAGRRFQKSQLSWDSSNLGRYDYLKDDRTFSFRY